MKKHFLKFCLAVVLAFVVTAPIALLNGCNSLHNTQLAGGVTDTNVVSATISTDIGTNWNVGVTGTYDLNTGDYTAGFIVTLKQAPDEFLRQHLVRAGGINNHDTIWVLPDTNSRDVDSAVFHALRAAGNAPGGAQILAWGKTIKP